MESSVRADYRGARKRWRKVPRWRSGRPAATRAMLFALLLSVRDAGAQDIPQWQLEPTPRVTIGGEGGPAEFLRITGVFQLSDGLIAVANGGTSEIRMFDGQGRHVATFGRQGGITCLGVHFDEDGVETVRAYRLRR